MLQKIVDSHGKALYALIAAYVIYQLILLLLPRFYNVGMGGSLLISVASAVVSVGLGLAVIHVLFNRIAAGKGSTDRTEQAELQRDVVEYQKGRDVVGTLLGLLSLALTAYVLYRIIGVIPGVLSAVLAWKGESLTELLGRNGTIAISVVIGIASLTLWVAILNFVFRKLEAKAG